MLKLGLKLVIHGVRNIVSTRRTRYLQWKVFFNLVMHVYLLLVKHAMLNTDEIRNNTGDSWPLNTGDIQCT